MAKATLGVKSSAAINFGFAPTIGKIWGILLMLAEERTDLLLQSGLVRAIVSGRLFYPGITR